MKGILTRVADDFLHSFNGTNKGASAKKYTAFVVVLAYLALHIPITLSGDNTAMLTLAGMNVTFILTLFGIGTYEKAAKPKDKNTDELPNS